MSQSGDTTTSQLPRHALLLRFLTRTQSEVTQMRACLPADPLALEPAAIAHVERVAHKIASEAEVFGFPEIEAIAGSIELHACGQAPRTSRARLELAARLAERISALQVHVQHALTETLGERVPESRPISALLPGFGVRSR